MSNSKYSVLFMRDDTDVRKYRLAPFWLKFFFICVFLLMVTTGTSIWFGAEFFERNNALEAQKGELQMQMGEMSVRLERLSNMEKILQKYDSKKVISLLSSGSAPTPAPVAKPVPVAKQIDLNKIFSFADAREVRVQNLQMRVKQRELTTSFEINNMVTARALSGIITLSLYTRAGEPVVVKTNINDLKFQIQRFKRIRTSFSLPERVKVDDVFGLRLEIKNLQGKVLFRETYPLYSILS
ncbi:MAG: hypothetical protein ACNI27_14625 [Desulfovibrio sp.]